MTPRQVAKNSGLKTFFTGKPCKHGHVAERHVSSGSCMECIRISCNTEHHREQCRQWRKDNLDRVKQLNDRWADSRRELTREWRKANIEHARQKDRDWYKRNAEMKKAKRRAGYNPEYARRSSKEWREANPQKSRASQQVWRKNNPARLSLLWKVNGARRRNAPGAHTVEDIKDIFKSQSGKCAYCKAKVGNDYHVDHIIAVTKGGTNYRSNLQILCPPCNHSKFNHAPIDFARSRGMLL